MKLGVGLATRKQETCGHVSTITISSGGLEREICERCGHVSFQFGHQIQGAIDRNAFARPVDSQTAPNRRVQNVRVLATVV